MIQALVLLATAIGVIAAAMLVGRVMDRKACEHTGAISSIEGGGGGGGGAAGCGESSSVARFMPASEARGGAGGGGAGGGGPAPSAFAAIGGAGGGGSSTRGSGGSSASGDDSGGSSSAAIGGGGAGGAGGGGASSNATPPSGGGTGTSTGAGSAAIDPGSVTNQEWSMSREQDSDLERRTEPLRSAEMTRRSPVGGRTTRDLAWPSEAAASSKEPADDGVPRDALGVPRDALGVPRDALDEVAPRWTPPPHPPRPPADASSEVRGFYEAADRITAGWTVMDAGRFKEVQRLAAISRAHHPIRTTASRELGILLGALDYREYLEEVERLRYGIGG